MIKIENVKLGKNKNWLDFQVMVSTLDQNRRYTISYCGTELHHGLSLDHCKIQRSYVEFRDQHEFNTLPIGWKISKGCYLYYEYDSNLKEYEFYKQQAEALGNLYDWVLSLQVIK